MKRFVFGFLLSCLPAAALLSQEVVHFFELGLPVYKVRNSLYNTITVLDSRDYTAAIGIVTTGITPTQSEKIAFKTPLEPQFTALVQELTDKTAGRGELLFQLKRFRFVEKERTRHCFISAALYAKKDDRYYPLSRLDTMLELSRPLVKNVQTWGSLAISDFVAKGLVLPAGGDVGYSLAEVRHIDSLEKRKIPLYTTAAYKDGIYRTPRAFLEQTPDWPDIVVGLRRDGSVTGVSARYPDGRTAAVENNKMYAVVYRGRPYMVTHAGIYPLVKMGDDFYFTTAQYQIMLNYANGDPIFIRYLPPPNISTGRPDPDDY
jgi:hypothetical protein